MGRWEPGAAGRLRRAALELYVQRGFEQTTVADIAGHAGLTERTFFRYFADKREVLFAGPENTQELVERTIMAAPKYATAVDMVAAAVEACAGPLTERPDLVRARQSVIAANASLQERDLFKLASLTGVTADALRKRGVSASAAALAAQVGVAVFKVAFEAWIADDSSPDLTHLIRAAFTELASITTGGTSRIAE